MNEVNLHMATRVTLPVMVTGSDILILFSISYYTV